MFSRYDNQAPSGGFNYLPETEENGPLAPFRLGEHVHKTVRIMTCIYKGEQGFSVYDVEENDRRMVIAGTFPYDLALNAFYNVTGEVILDKKGLRQLRVLDCESTLPSDKAGVITVLRTLHGLDTQAHKLYDLVGPDILDILIKDPQRVSAMVKGVGIKRAKAWQAELLARGENDRELRKLYAVGLSPKQATRLVSAYGIQVCSEVQGNPYFLMGKVRGYSFATCDKIALDSGQPIMHPARIREGMLSVLSTIERAGHCAYPKKYFLQASHALLDVSLNMKTAMQMLRSAKTGSTASVKIGGVSYPVDMEDLAEEVRQWRAASHSANERFSYVLDPIPSDLMEAALADLQAGDRLVAETVGEESFVTPGMFYRAETSIAANVRDLVANERLPFKTTGAVIKEVLSSLGVVLEERQMAAVSRICAAEGGLFILNGSAGCGKTFTLNVIVKVLEALYEREREFPFNPCILAPTGKAAKVAASSTGLPAQTIHRALGLVSSSADSFLMAGGAIANNCIVVDEFSMVDEVLCSQLLSGIPKTSKVVLLGDTEQLPSIRAGRVLKDLIESGVVPVITLNVVKRQSEQSGVLANANKIIRGEQISSVLTNKTGTEGNAYVRPCTEVFRAQSEILRMAKNCGLKAFQDGQVQVLCPLKAGPVGTEEMNYFLQQLLNPREEGREVVIGRTFVHQADDSEVSVPQTFRVGDCVIHTKNNYEQPWYTKHPVNGFIETARSGVVNGDTGIIDSIVVYQDSAKQTHQVLYVRYDDHYISYDNDYEELSLAYALTIHKSQGSQWPLVLCPIVQPTRLLNRNLLYTMYTRAQSSNVTVGNPDLILRAIRNNKEDRRITLLQKRLRRE